jgi:hypothetical protein
MSEIILWEDKEYVEMFQQLTELFRTKELENFNKRPSGTPNIMAKIGNCAGAMSYRIYQLYGENPEFETVDKNLKIEIPFGEIPEEMILRNRVLLMLANGKHVKGDNVVYVFQEEGFSVYPKVDAVLRRLEEAKIKEFEESEELKLFAETCIARCEPEVQAQNLALALFKPEISRQQFIASQKGQPGSQE